MMMIAPKCVWLSAEKIALNIFIQLSEKKSLFKLNENIISSIISHIICKTSTYIIKYVDWITWDYHGLLGLRNFEF